MAERYLSMLMAAAFALAVGSGPVLAQATSSDGGETSAGSGGNTTNDNSSVDSGTENSTGTSAGESSPSGDADSADSADTGTEDNCAPNPNQATASAACGTQ